MTGKNSLLQQALLGFAQQYVQAYQTQYSHLPLIEHDDEWPSPCFVSTFKEGEADCWQPIAIEESLSLSNVEKALELNLHLDIKEFFTTLYSDSLDASCEHGDLSLLFLWSEPDFERLQENIIGHVLMKQKLKQELTIFFGVTNEEDLILSVKNDNGEVWVERVGKEPHKKLADSLTEFIGLLTPRIP
ncbi:SecY-interacting protein [Thalassotalea atypica]|uniref:SecY-interacting protein n=1 Tax=Thalassotalea atypica TaxID=2054316 RepID=UPI002572C710|nr:SecY-interacting protein [Thalassotalea atypica]